MCVPTRTNPPGSQLRHFVAGCRGPCAGNVRRRPAAYERARGAIRSGSAGQQQHPSPGPEQASAGGHVLQTFRGLQCGRDAFSRFACTLLLTQKASASQAWRAARARWTGAGFTRRSPRVTSGRATCLLFTRVSSRLRRHTSCAAVSGTQKRCCLPPAGSDSGRWQTTGSTGCLPARTRAC